MKKYLNLKSVAEAYDVNLKSLQYMCQTGQLPATKFGKRWYIKPSDIQRMFEAGENTCAQERWNKVQRLTK